MFSLVRIVPFYDFTRLTVDYFSSGSFFTTDEGLNMTWSTVSSFQSVFETVQLQIPRLLTENAKGQAEWGQFYFATARVRLLSEISSYSGHIMLHDTERCRYLWRRFCRLVDQHFF